MVKRVQIHALAVASALSWALVSPSLAQDAGELADLRRAALGMTNAARAEAGLSELSHSDLLDQTAQEHALDMLARDFHDHVTPEGDTPLDRFISAGGSRWAISGENIANCRGCSVPPGESRVEAFHDGWMQSPGHRENILSDKFDSFGFGIVGEDDRVYAVQTFSGPGADTGDGENTALHPRSAREIALEHINAARSLAGLDLLEHDEALDTVAGRVLSDLLGDVGAVPANLFDLLPEHSSGWTSLALQTASIGGAGTVIDREDLSALISGWAEAEEPDQILGGPAASHAGVAVEASGDGRVTAVALFAGR